MSPGERLRRLRVERGLTMADVEEYADRLARKNRNAAYAISTGRLSQIETSKSIPSIHKLGTLSLTYRVPCIDLLKIYGIKTKG